MPNLLPAVSDFLGAVGRGFRNDRWYALTLMVGYGAGAAVGYMLGRLHG